MQDQSKTKQELIQELASLRQRNAELEQSKSEHKKVEEALQYSRNMLQTVLDSIPSSVFWKDCDSIYLGGNRNWLEVVGLKSSEEVVGKSDFDLPWENTQADSFREYDRRVTESGIPEYDIIEPYLRADGTHAWAKTNKVPLLDTEGKVVGVLGTYEDITKSKLAEDVLRKSEEKYRSIFENSVEGIFQTNHEGRYISVNPALARIFGHKSPEDMISSVADIGKQLDVYPEQRKERLRLLDEKGVLESYEAQMYRKDGSVIWVSINVRLVRDDAGNLICYEGFVTDITNRKQLEDALRDSEEKFSRAFHFAPNMMSISSIEEGVYFNVNTRFLEVTGFEREEVVGKTSTELGFIEPATRELLKRQLINDGRVAGMEIQLRKKDGLKIICIYHGEIITFEEKRYLLSLAEDITERKKVEEALRDAETKYRTVADNTFSWEFWIDPSGTFIYSSPSCERVTGYTANEFERDKYLSRRIIHPKDMEVFEAHVVEANKHHLPGCVSFRIIHKDGTEKWIEHNCQPVYNESGIFIGNRGSNRDMTERKRVEEELKCYAKELEDANTALRVFMSRRDNDQKMLEEKLQFNIGDIVVPYLKKLNETDLDSRQKNYLSVLESNLNNIVSPYMLNLSATYKNLTPQEIQIANLIRHGKNTKDIAELLCTSVHTIGTHRNNIRKKLNLRNSKTNLRSYLLSLS